MIFERVLRHPLTLPLYLPALIAAVSAGLLKLILPLYAAAITESYFLIGVILAGEALGTILGDVLAGMLLSRLGDKRVMQLGLLIVIGSMVTVFFVTPIPLIILTLVIFGIGRGLYNVSQHMYLADRVVLGNRGRAIAMYGGIGRIGQTVGPALGGFMIAAFGLQVPFLVVAGFMAVTLAVVTLLLHSNNEKADDKPHHASLIATFRDNSHVFATAGAGQLFAQMTRAGRTAIIPLFADKILGLNPDMIGIILSVSWGLDMLLFYPAGWIMDNLGRKRAIIPSFIIQATGLALIPFTQNFAGLLVAAAIIGLGNGISSGTMMTLGSDLAPPRSRGEFLGVWRLIGDAGATGAPLVIGWIAGLVVLQTAAGVISGTGILAAMIFTFLVPETLKK